MNELVEAKEDVVEAGKKMLEKGLVVGTWGNVSVRVTDDFVITPSGMDYEKLNPEDMVVVDLEGKTIEGKWKPSIEISMHLAIYKARKDVNAIIHAHPIFSSTLAVLRQEIPPVIEDMVMLLGEKVKVAKYALPGTKELAENVTQALGERNAALLANHGSLCVGPDIDKTLTAYEILEKSAQIFILSKIVGKPIPLATEDIEKMRVFFVHKYGQR